MSIKYPLWHIKRLHLKFFEKQVQTLLNTTSKDWQIWGRDDYFLRLLPDKCMPGKPDRLPKKLSLKQARYLIARHQGYDSWEKVLEATSVYENSKQKIKNEKTLKIRRAEKALIDAVREYRKAYFAIRGHAAAALRLVRERLYELEKVEES